jgi:hypothetical protein
VAVGVYITVSAGSLGPLEDELTHEHELYGAAEAGGSGFFFDRPAIAGQVNHGKAMVVEGVHGGKTAQYNLTVERQSPFGMDLLRQGLNREVLSVYSDCEV